MEHGFGGSPRIRGQLRMPPRGSHQPQPQLIPTRIMNTNAWQHNSMSQHFAQSPEEGLNYQQPMGDGFHHQAAAYSQYPPNMPSPDAFIQYPAAQMYPAIYHPPAPIESPQAYAQVQSTSKTPGGMQLSRDVIITCSSCHHRNALADSEFVKKDEEIAQLKMQLTSLRAKMLEVEEQLQRRMSTLQPQKAAAGEIAVQPSSENVAVPSKSLLSPNAVEFNPIPQRTVSNNSAAEVPVVSAKGVSDEPSCVEVQAEEGFSYELAVEEQAVECEPKSVQTSPVREEYYKTSAKEEEEGADVRVDGPKSEPQDPEPESQPETLKDMKPVAASDEWCEERQPQQQQNINTNSRPPNVLDTRNNNQRQSGRRASDSVPYGGFVRDKPSRGRDQDHFNNDSNRNYTRSRGYPNQNRSHNYRGSSQRSNDDGGRENWRESQRDTNSPRERDELGNQGVSAGRRENQSQRNDRNRHTRDETSNDGNRGQPDAEGFQTQGPRVRGGRGPEDNISKFHYNNRSQENSKEFTGGSSSSKAGPTVNNVVKELKGDLFSAPAEFSLAHCVARDFRMGSGIAVEFRTRFKRVSELLDQDVRVGGCAYLTDKDRFIFYLVTKELSTGKPTYHTLGDSLRQLRDHCHQLGVNKLAIPRIGCGLDRLDWLRVKHMLNETFQDCNMQVHAYEFNVEGLPEAEGNRLEARSGTHVKYEKMNLSAIEKQTALLFLGTEDGYVDSVATSLDARFKFLTSYKKTQKTVGKVWRHMMPDYYIYGLIVAKTKKKVLFSDLDECFRSLSKMMRQDQFEYIGLEVSKDWNCEDTLFTEKMTVLLRNMLPRSVKQLWVCFPDEKLDRHGFCAKYASKQPQNPPA